MVRLTLAIVSWLFIIYSIIYLSPTPIVLGFFHFFVFFALLSTSALIFGLTRHTLFVSLGITAIIVLQAYRMAHIINVFLLMGILVSLELLLQNP